MGFGLLLFGYVTAYLMSVNILDFAFRLVGYAVMLCALLKLRRYHGAFLYPAVGVGALLTVSAVRSVYELSLFLYDNLLLDRPWLSESVFGVVTVIDTVLIFVFHAVLLYAVRAIAKETGVEKIAQNAVRNFVFVCLYYAVMLVSRLPIDDAQMMQWLSAASLVSMLVFMVLNVLLIFSCYAKICDENDQEMEQKPSRFAFVNRFRAELNRREEKAMREDAAYREERQRRKQSKKQGGRHGKR